ncbi:MAG: ABC transporter substrate-binding protein [Oligoflexia bacterium]|nr:ABC transporter substrate-binding protein [Oligoflexia bacterium]
MMKLMKSFFTTIIVLLLFLLLSSLSVVNINLLAGSDLSTPITDKDIDLHTFNKNGSIWVVWLNPQDDKNIFWLDFETCMKAAATSLGVKITILHSSYSQFAMVNNVKALISKTKKPDFIVFSPTKMNGPIILDLAEKAGIKTFILNAGLSSEEKKTYGGPRNKFKNWIGEILADDESAGYVLAEELIKMARAKKLNGTDDKIHICAINGNPADGSAIERLKGLQRSLRNHKDVILEQVFTSFNWNFEDAKTITQHVQQRYPETRIIWSANDTMAMGSVDGYKASVLKPGISILIGGVDWTQEALALIKENKLAVSVGGHFFQGAWALVLLYDYFNGIDFVSENLEMKSDMTSISWSNIGDYKNLISRRTNNLYQNIDFKKFSKKFNPDLKTYNFSIYEAMKISKK